MSLKQVHHFFYLAILFIFALLALAFIGSHVAFIMVIDVVMMVAIVVMMGPNLLILNATEKTGEIRKTLLFGLFTMSKTKFQLGDLRHAMVKSTTSAKTTYREVAETSTEVLYSAETKLTTTAHLELVFLDGTSRQLTLGGDGVFTKYRNLNAKKINTWLTAQRAAERGTKAVTGAVSAVKASTLLVLQTSQHPNTIPPCFTPPNLTFPKQEMSNFQRYLSDRLLEVNVLTWKNYKIAQRTWKSTLAQFISPVLALLLMGFLQWIINVSRDPEVFSPTPELVAAVPHCIPNDDPDAFCHTILFTPAVEPYVSIMQLLGDHNGRRHGAAHVLSVSPTLTATKEASLESDIMGVADRLTMSKYVYAHPNRTLLAIEFLNATALYGGTAVGTDFALGGVDTSMTHMYSLWYNQTFAQSGYDLRRVVRRALDEALLSYSAGSPVDMTVREKDWPELWDPEDETVVVNNGGALFFYVAAMANFVVIINQVVSEKERHLREGMRVMGLKDSSFWISWFLTNLVFLLFGVFTLVPTGLALGYDFFIKTDFLVLIYVFFTFGLAMIPFAFFLSTFINKSSTANSIGFVVFVAGLLIQLILGNTLLYTLYLLPSWVTFILQVWPPFNFTKAYVDITQLSALSFDFDTFSYVAGVGFKYDDLFGNEKYQDFLKAFPIEGADKIELPATIESIYAQLIMFLIYAVLTWYFDAIIASGDGTARPWYFFVQPSYWGLSVTRAAPKQAYQAYPGEDADVDEERKTVHADDCDYLVRILNLTRIFFFEGAGGTIFHRMIPVTMLDRKHQFVAVDRISFGISENEIFCLLGHNGAGKTTTINMLTGNLTVTSGDGLVSGTSIVTDMTDVRTMIGVCPQHDILWDHLTAAEHITLFSRFKRIPKDKIEDEILRCLSDVQLVDVRNNRCDSFSGGMKRRLSVAISSVGNPKFIQLDEPSTGMDPVSRRSVWEAVKRLRKGRAIMMTTHSMEEADVLGDRIGIMGHGKMLALGASLRLKNRFGAGYRLSLLAKTEEGAEILVDWMKTVLPEAVLADRAACSLIFTLDTTDTADLQKFFAQIESQGPHTPVLSDWGMSQCTLEEVFLRLTSQSHSLWDKSAGHAAAVPAEQEMLPMTAMQ